MVRLSGLKRHFLPKGFIKLKGLDFHEVFAPIVKLNSIPVLCLWQQMKIALYISSYLGYDIPTSTLLYLGWELAVKSGEVCLYIS